MSNDSVLEPQLGALKTAPEETLRERWKALCPKPYPDHLPRALIVSFIAYRLQASHFGDLDPDAARYLNSVASAEGSGSQLARFEADKTRFSPGTVFVREHEGQVHRAIRTKRGFEWDGRDFQSLSAVARAGLEQDFNSLDAQREAADPLLRK